MDLTSAGAERPLTRGERGASAVEYALLIAGIAAVVVAAVILLGGSTQALFQDGCGAALQAAGGDGVCD